jgi:hypothetical protein
MCVTYKNWNQENINHLKEIYNEQFIKSLSIKKSPVLDKFFAEFYQTLKEEYQCSSNYSMKHRGKENYHTDSMGLILR